MPGPVADIALKLALYANSRAADLGHTASSTLVAFPHERYADVPSISETMRA